MWAKFDSVYLIGKTFWIFAGYRLVKSIFREKSMFIYAIILFLKGHSEGINFCQTHLDKRT
jgi:hypothetical protein